MKYVKLDRELIQNLNIDYLNILTQYVSNMDELSAIEKDIYTYLLDQTIYAVLTNGTNMDTKNNIYMDFDLATLKNIFSVETTEQVTKVLLHFVDKHLITTELEFHNLRFENSIIFERLYLLIPQPIYNRITNKPVEYQEEEEKFYY